MVTWEGGGPKITIFTVTSFLNGPLHMATNLKEKGLKVKSGQKLCCRCVNKYDKIMNEPEEITIDENGRETEEELQIEDDSAKYEESPRKKPNTSLGCVGVFPSQHSCCTKAQSTNQI